MIRTSISHPLEIAEVQAPGGGRVGITFCPGKQQAYAATGAWARDLAIDLQAIKGWGAGMVLTLVEAAELKHLKVEGIGAETRRLGMQWLHLPITDVSTPTAEWQRQWETERGTVHAELDRGGAVLVHCKGGLGRAGTVAALILKERGMAAEKAITVVRSVRSGAVETEAQEAFVASHLGSWAAE